MTKRVCLLAGLLLAGCGETPFLMDVPADFSPVRAAMGPRYPSAERYVKDYLKTTLAFDTLRDFKMRLVGEWDSFEFSCYATQGEQTYYVEGTFADAWLGRPHEVFIHQKRPVKADGA